MLEINTYKWSQQIAEFNYDENHQILEQICKPITNETDILNILYATSLIELLGDKYIHSVIKLNKTKFMVADDDFSNAMNKYLEWQTHTASSYTIMIRNAAKIIEYKYNALLSNTSVKYKDSFNHFCN